MGALDAEIEQGIEVVKQVCVASKLGFYLDPEVRKHEFVRFTLSAWAEVEGKTGYRADALDLSYEFVCDLPGTRSHQRALQSYLQSFSWRLGNVQPNEHMTLSGIPIDLDIEWPFRSPPDGRDGHIVSITCHIRPLENIQTRLSVGLSRTVEVGAVPILERILTESITVNAVRKAVDSGSIRFSPPEQDVVGLQKVMVSSADYDYKARRFNFAKPSEEEIREFLKRKVYWLGFREGVKTTKVWVGDPYDAEYLATTPQRLGQLAQRLAAEGFLHVDATGNLAYASDDLLKLEEVFQEELESGFRMPVNARKLSKSKPATTRAPLQTQGGPTTEGGDKKEKSVYAHVLYTDIVSYSAQPMEAQQKMFAQLQEGVRGTPTFAEAEANHKVITLVTGDGMALAFFGDPETAARCAIELSTTLRTTEVHLRMGIHFGPVFICTDINGNVNVVGGGVNIAQRVMDFGDGGHILVSGAAAEALQQFGRWKSLLHDIGEAEAKHGVRIHVFNLYSGEAGNSETPTKLRKPIPADQIRELEKQQKKIVGAADWQGLADRFKRIDSAIRADWHRDTNGSESWRICGGFVKECESLCRLGAAMLGSSPSVFDSIPVDIQSERDPIVKWLKFLQETGAGKIDNVLHGVATGPNGKEIGIFLGGSINGLGQASSIACLDCAAKET